MTELGASVVYWGKKGVEDREGWRTGRGGGQKGAEDREGWRTGRDGEQGGGR